MAPSEKGQGQGQGQETDAAYRIYGASSVGDLLGKPRVRAEVIHGEEEKNREGTGSGGNSGLQSTDEDP